MQIYYTDPTDPTQVFYSPLPDNATPEEQELYQRTMLKMLLRGFVTFIAVVALLAIVSLLTGSCTPQRIFTDTSEQRLSHEMVQRMDSLLSVRSITRQDSIWRQEILRQFQSIRESSDTSHSVTLNATGDTIRERIIIRNNRESNSETYRQQLTVMAHRLEVMDSTVQAQNLQLVRMDSLLRQQKQTEIKEVPPRLNWFQQLQLWLGRLVLLTLAIAAAVFILRWWLRVKKVLPSK